MVQISIEHMVEMTDRPVPGQALLAAALVELRSACADDGERIDRIGFLERAKSALAAVQVQLMVDFETSQLQVQESQGVPVRRRGLGIADQIGFATKCSPSSASRRLADARALVNEMPATLQALATGRMSERGVRAAVTETRCLTRVDRGRVDASSAVVGSMSVPEISQAVRRRVIELDQDAASAERTGPVGPVRVHPTAAGHDGQDHRGPPGGTSRRVFRACGKQPRPSKATGDERTKAQIKADTFIQRITGQTTATAIPVEVQLVMTSDALLGRSEEPAQLPGHGPVPAFLARRIITRDPDATSARVWVRRLLTDPIDDTVATVDTRRRRFDGALAVLINARDQVCRDPYCSAPIRDLDHLHDHADGGPTSADNGIGLCQRGNLVDQIPGWHTTGTAKHRVVITPTGHRYDTRPPPALGPRLRHDRTDRLGRLPRAG